MFPARTKGGGQCVAFPDVCKVPPAPGVPVPFPNIAMCANASDGTCAKKVKIAGAKAQMKKTVIPSSLADQGGVLKGVMSMTVGSKVTCASASDIVVIEGSPAVGLGPKIGRTKHNKDNAMMGMQVSPSQTKVFIHK